MVNNLIPANPKTQTKTINITTNGNYTIFPDVGCLLLSVIAEVNISGVALINKATSNINKYGVCLSITCPGYDSNSYKNIAVFPYPNNDSGYLGTYKLFSVLNNQCLYTKSADSDDIYIGYDDCIWSGDTVKGDHYFATVFDYMFVAWN